jgi:non-ribosomal peptide synthetase component E (peptide arylation enzyme)
VAPAELEVSRDFHSVRATHLIDRAKALLLTHPEVKDAAVVAVYDESQATELPRAYVVVNEHCATASPEIFEKEIQEFVAKKVGFFSRHAFPGTMDLICQLRWRLRKGCEGMVSFPV